MPIITPSNLEYLGSKPNFTRDTYQTFAEMQEALEAGHIDEGHQTYCVETGITYKALPSDTDGTLVWVDTLGELRDDLTGKLIDTERVAGEAFWDLNEKIKGITDELTGEGEWPGGTRLDQVYDWYDDQTHQPVFGSSWDHTSGGNYRQGTTHTFRANYSWSWATRGGATGTDLKVGSGNWQTVTFKAAGLEPEQEGGYTTRTVTLTLADQSIGLSAKFNDPAGSGASMITVTPLVPEYSWDAILVVPDGWETFNTQTSHTLAVAGSGRNLPESSIGDKIYGSAGGVIKTIDQVTDEDVSVVETNSISSGSIRTYSYSWKDASGNTRNTYSVRPAPSFIFISQTANAWNGSLSTLPAFVASSQTKYQAWMKTGAITSPMTEFSAGSTMVYLSPYDIRSSVVQSRANGSSQWTTINGFTGSGTITYLGITYYYRLNPNIGAGTFSFKFS